MNRPSKPLSPYLASEDWWAVWLGLAIVLASIVLLGATLALTLIFTAGPVAFLQATIMSLATWFTIYLAATRFLGMAPQFGAVLGAGGAVCGVSASIAVGGAVKAQKERRMVG
jgi:uncharacterized membrane protein YadS